MPAMQALEFYLVLAVDMFLDGIGSRTSIRF